MSGYLISLAVTGTAHKKLVGAFVKFSVAGLLLLFSFISFRQNAVWRDNISLFTNALYHNPQETLPYKMLGRTYFDEGDYEKAFYYFGKYREKNPYTLAYPFYIAFYYYRMNDLDKAEETLNTYIRPNGGFIYAYCLYGHIYQNKGNFEKAGCRGPSYRIHRLGGP